MITEYHATVLSESERMMEREGPWRENLIRFFHGFNHDAHPMAIMVGVVGALSAFYNDGMDIRDETHRDKAAIRVFGKITTIAAMVGCPG